MSGPLGLGSIGSRVRGYSVVFRVSWCRHLYCGRGGRAGARAPGALTDRGRYAAALFSTPDTHILPLAAGGKEMSAADAYPALYRIIYMLHLRSTVRWCDDVRQVEADSRQ